MLALDLFSGLGGFSDGLRAAGWDCVGIEIDPRFKDRYQGQLVIQDVMTFDGRRAAGRVGLIVASPPCQTYSYLSMPWSRSTNPENSKAAKALRRRWETNGPDNRLFEKCLELAEQIGCPIVVENVKGAQEWLGPVVRKYPWAFGDDTGKAKAHYGSYYLWGSVSAVGGRVVRDDARFGGVSEFAAPSIKAGRMRKVEHHLGGDVPEGTGKTSWLFGNTKHELRSGVKVPTEGEGRRTDKGKGARFTSRDCGNEATKNYGGSWFAVAHNRESGVGHNPVNHNTERFPGRKGPGGDWFANGRQGQDACIEGLKQGGEWWHDPESRTRRFSSRSAARREASAQIAKIPFELAKFIGEVFLP